MICVLGSIQTGETLTAATLRLTRETVGLYEHQLDIDRSFDKTLNYSVNGIQKGETYRLARLIYGNTKITRSRQYRDHRWVTIIDARQLVRQHNHLRQLFYDADAYLTSKYR